MKKILVTGSAGYVGSVLVRKLLKQGYQVVGYDNLTFGGSSLIELMGDKSFSFVRGDVRDLSKLELALTGVDGVVHLAAIVGDPACAAQPDEATEINYDATVNLYELAKSKKVKRFIFISTCSNYGKMSSEQEYVTEESKLAPVSLYASLKVKAEKYILDEKNKINTTIPTILRFATAYGISPRPRFDLTVNEFVREISLDRNLVVFGEQFWRPYCHVEDLARSAIVVLEAEKEKVDCNVYNVGDTSENYQKKMLLSEIDKIVKGQNISYVQKKEDPRDYRVSFDKINKNLNFKVTKKVPDGIKEINSLVASGIISDLDSDKYRNV